MGKPLSATELLECYRRGDRSALERLLPQVYRELRRIAGHHLKGERPGHTLQPTALVHEAFLLMSGQKDAPWENRAHFLAAAAKIMRWVLLDHAKAKRREKRGGGALRVTFEEHLHGANQGLDFEALHEALEKLEAADPRRAQVVELRFFGGLSVEETADVLQTSPATVKRDWTLAKAWLFRELNETEIEEAG